MDYNKLYLKFVKSRRDRDFKRGYYNHHIVPKFFGGLDDESNKVKLTAREHYFAHLVLVKIYNGSPEAIRAVIGLANLNGYSRKVVSRLFNNDPEVRDKFKTYMKEVAKKRFEDPVYKRTQAEVSRRNLDAVRSLSWRKRRSVSDRLILEIRMLYNTGLVTQSWICKNYNLAQSLVSRLVRYERFNKVKV